MKKYKPNTAISTYEFLTQFPNEEAAKAYLENERWGDGIVCPRCGCKHVTKWSKKEGWFRCIDCREPFNVRTGTIFQNSKIPLNKWLFAFYFIVTARKAYLLCKFLRNLALPKNPLGLCAIE
jgi:transposase-like protein